MERLLKVWGEYIDYQWAYQEKCDQWVETFIEKFTKSVPPQIDQGLTNIQIKGNTETERQAYLEACKELFADDADDSIYNSLSSAIYDAFKENTGGDANFQDYLVSLIGDAEDAKKYLYSFALEDTLKNQPQFGEPAPPVDLDDEAQGARDEMIDRILESSDSGHITTENAKDIAETVDQLIDKTNKQNLWSEGTEIFYPILYGEDND